MPGLPGWELGPGPADPALSASFGTYAGTGYASPRFTSNPHALPGSQGAVPGPPPASQDRLPTTYLGADGNVYGYDSVTGIAYKVS